MIKFRHVVSAVLVTLLTLLLSSCKLAMLNPKGVVAHSEMQLLVTAVLLMLIVVIPVIILTFVIIFKYRASNKKAKYTPNKAHNTLLEVICWSIPGIIIIILAVLTWRGAHKLDPYRPLNKSKPLTIQVISLNWRWLFIYPQQQVATINYVQIPIHKQIKFVITGDSPMNSLDMPQLAGQIYAMSGMMTKLHFSANTLGTYRGFAANYTGDGFANMVFHVHVTTQAQFNHWVNRVHHQSMPLTIAKYQQLRKPSMNREALYFSVPITDLFHRVVMSYMMPSKSKMSMEKSPTTL